MGWRGTKKAGLTAAAAAALAVLSAPAARADIAVGGPPPESWSGLARFGAVSPDGRRVVFSSRQPLTDGDRDLAKDVYLRAGGRTVLLSTGGGAGKAGERVSFEAATPDARTVLFRTEDRLTAQDDDSSWDLYRRSPSGLELVSPGPQSQETADKPRSAAVSAGGSRVFFATSERLAVADDDDRQDVYEYRRGGTRLVSVGADRHVRLLAVAADGSRVVFDTGAGLVPADTDGHDDIYVRAAGATTLLSGGDLGSCPVAPSIPAGCSLESVESVAASADASRIFFETWDRLVPSDSDSLADVYMHGPGGLELISTGPADSHSFDASLATITLDGRRAFFLTPEAFGSLNKSPHTQLFERRGRRTSVVSADGRELIGVDSEEPVFVSDDGGHVVFSGGGEIYLRTGRASERISGNPTPPFDQFGTYLKHGSTAGAGRAVFVTVRRLDRRDRDNAYDLYASGPRGIEVVSVGPLGGNASAADPIGAFIDDVPTFGGATPDGRFVYFTSEERLLRSDRDRKIDLYERGPAGLKLVSVAEKR